MEQPTSLASIYQARKKAEGDSSTTVEVLKKQFQDQIERILHDKNGQAQPITKSYIPSSNEREVRNFKKLEREKSFDEARNAVQSQIEKIFEKAKNNSNKPLSPKPNIIKCGLATPLALIRPPIPCYPEEEEYDLENHEGQDFQSPEPLRMPAPSSLNQRMLQKSKLSSTSPIEPRSKRSSSVESGIVPPPPPPLLINSTSTENVLFSSPDIIQKEPVPEEPEEFPPPPEIVKTIPPRTTTFVKMNGHQRRPSVHQPLYRERPSPISFSSMSQLDQLKKDNDFIPLIVPPKKRRSSTSSSSSSTSTCSCEEIIRKKPVKKPPPRPKPKPSPRRKKNRAPAPVVKPKPIEKVPDAQEESVNNVEYLGALPLSEKASDLGSLQIPLKILYFKYLEKVFKNTNHKRRPQKCFLDIDSNGLKITFPGKENEFTYNPFPTIAVWAAIRFIHRESPDDKHNNAFAFLPLISDPCDKEKKSLFHDLSRDELVYTQKNVYHPPLFACIMRRHGVSRKLECHGFVCDTKEDAISIAADLFKSLMSSVELQTNKPKRRNSTISSKSSSISVVSSRLRKNRSLRQSKRINNSIARRKLQEKESGIKGDIYTKVAMPRSRSFMNVNGQYNLQDLFQELREKEGIESVDDVLRLVISPHGMSFNKIPPMYRDLLMKLVMSMSKDEIFIRSKNIMMEELKKSKKSSKKGFLLRKRKKSVSIKAKDLDKELKKLTIGNPVPIDLDQIQKFPPSKAIDLNLIKKTQERSVFINAKPIISSSSSSSSSNQKVSSKASKRSSTNSRRISSGESEYKSCSECGYTSVCGTLCSCSGMDESSSSPPASRKSNSNPSSSNCTCKECDESLSIYCSSCTSVASCDEDEKMSIDSVVVEKEWPKKLSTSSNTTTTSSPASSSPPKSEELFINSSTYTEFETEDSKGKTMSSDSLSSSSSSYSSSHCDSLSGEHPQKLHRKSEGSVIYKGPRPAYSESNMHNSLGYLP